jgi:RecA/RadA recombinase
MTTLIKRRQDKSLEETAQEVESALLKPVERKKPLEYNRVVSTGSTLLDLAISGGRVRGGGIPAGIIVEIYGPSGCGKTAILVESGTGAQFKGGSVWANDPEARLNKEYAAEIGLDIKSKFKYDRPDTVNEMFDNIQSWETDPKYISVFLGDSTAALSTDEELKGSDKYGMKRAKDFSEGLRKTCRIISTNDKLVLLTNQIRESGDKGGFGPSEVTPGGKAMEFYCSLRMRVYRYFPSWQIKKEISLKEGKEEIKEDVKKEKKVNDEKKDKDKLTKVIGVRSTVYIAKSSVDDPYRNAPISLIFGYGIDDIRENLTFLKEMRQVPRYPAINKDWHSLDKAIEYIEANEYQLQLREQVIDLWEEIEQKFKVVRKPKVRF